MLRRPLVRWKPPAQVFAAVFFFMPPGKLLSGHLDRLEHRFDFSAASLKPRRKQQALAKLIGRLVHGKSRGNRGGTFDKNSTRAAAINGVEVHAVLDLRSVRVAKLFVDTLLLRELFIVLNFKRHVVRSPRPEDPASGGTIGLVKKSDRLVGAAISDFKAVIGAFLTSLLEGQSVHKEAFGFGNFPDR